MLAASILGPATSPGTLLHSRHTSSTADSSSPPLPPLFHPLLDQSTSPDTPLHKTVEAGYGNAASEEELVWWNSTVVWSRGAQLYRQWTFEEAEEKVTWAGHVWFPSHTTGSRVSTSPSGSSGRNGRGNLNSSNGSSSSRGSGGFGSGINGQGKAATFGPFHHSQHAVWGAPSPASSSSSSTLSPNRPILVRTLMICLKTLAHVYYPSGEDTTLHLPFIIDTCFPLSLTSGGGVLLQRELEKREVRQYEGRTGMTGSILRGIDTGIMSVLDEVVDLNNGDGDDGGVLPRLYTLMNPFEELKMVVQCRIRDDGMVMGQEESIQPSTTVLFITQDPYPLVVTFDRSAREVTFYRRLKKPLLRPSAPPPPPSVRTMLPEELLAAKLKSPTTAPIPNLQSLSRNPSNFSTTSERRVSGAADPMDRTRRGPRVSRGGVVDPQLPTTGAGELQAALDPPALAPPSAPPPSRVKGKGRVRQSTAAEEARRQSGASSSMREEVDVRMVALNGAAERDLRETTMMMGLEKSGEGSRSEVVLEPVWLWKPPENADMRAAKIHISENLSPESVHIDIHVSNMLYIFHAQLSSGWTITPLVSIPCSSAIPVISTRDISDTLILDNGKLQIITSGTRSIPLIVPRGSFDGRDELPRKLASSLSMVLEGDSDDSMSGDLGSAPVSYRIVAMEDGVGGKCTVVFDDGEKARVNVDLRITNVLVNKCLDALSWVLPADAFFVVKREVITAVQSRLGLHQDETVWEVFVSTLSSVIGLEDSISASAQDNFVQSVETSSDPLIRRLVAKLGSQISTSTSPKQPQAGQPPIERIDPSNMVVALLALHLVAQDYRLSSCGHIELVKLAKVLMDLSAAIGRWDWWDYWMRLMPTAKSSTPVSFAGFDTLDTSILDAYETPPDILSYLSRRIITPLKPFPTPQSVLPHRTPELGLTRPCGRTTLVISIYDRLGVSTSASDSKARPQSLIGRASAMVRHMTDCGLDNSFLADLPSGIAMPILEMIRVCQNAPEKDWPAAAYHFVGRTDLAAQAMGGWTVSRDGAEVLDDEIPTVGSIIASVSEGKGKTKGVLPALPHVRFGSDRRIAEVERILQTTKVRTISVQEPKNASDQEIVQYHQNVVNTIANRTLSVSIGQGMFEYGTRVTTITDPWEIPLIELSVKIVPSATTLQAQIAAENADWPCFHNGVAAALSISPDCTGIDSSWIVFNRPSTLNPEHGGFLLGLGLTGHLRSLMTYHAFPYMEPRHDFTSVGLLLGLACSYAGSEDLLITKVLSLHTHALLPLGSMELNASAIIQSSAFVGLGFVYAGSRNLRMAEVALDEVGRKEMAGVESFVDHREAYSFSASMAFGLIMLGRGGQVTSEVDRKLLAQLRICIMGEGPLLESRKGAVAIDTTITAPGATLALGLMYLKTGRKDIADMLEIPQSAFALENVRPDLLLIRTFARALIMWEHVAPSLAWIEAQLPDFIPHRGHKKTSAMELHTELAYLNIVAGACLAIGLKYAGTATEMAHNNLTLFFGVLSKAAAGQSMTYEAKIRRNAARQGLNVVTIALSVVMSGTGELNVLRRLRVSHGQEGAGVTYGTHTAMHMACGILFLGRGHYTLGSSNLAIAAMSVAFFPRFLSSPGDNRAYPQAFRHLWALAVEPRCLIARDIETRETVYLPVKVRLRDGDQVRQQNLISPTLIAPFESIISIEVDSPRYWPITYDLSNPRDRDTLVRTRTIHVKRKAGFLDYSLDPKGIRSIFVRAGSMTGFDLHYDLISPAAPPTISASEVVELITAHSGDPTLIALSERFAGDTPFEVALRIILLECVSLDKQLLLPVYMSLLLSLTLSDDMTLEMIAQLNFLRTFYAPGVFERDYLLPTSSGERRFPLMRPNTITALYRCLVDSPGDINERERREYLANGQWGEDAKGLAAYICRNNVPPIRMLQLLGEKVRREGNSATMLVKVRDIAIKYTEAVMGQWDVSGGRDGRVGLWRMTSVEQALKIWLGE